LGVPEVRFREVSLGQRFFCDGIGVDLDADITRSIKSRSRIGLRTPVDRGARLRRR
jgi:hypothetical protein